MMKFGHQLLKLDSIGFFQRVLHQFMLAPNLINILCGMSCTFKAVRSRISRSLGFLKYAKKLLPKHTLCQMYRGIVEPHFRYCCSVLGSCGDSRLLMLQKLQNRAARIVTNSN